MIAENVFTPDEETNPYIALSDLAINLVLILAFFVSAANAVGRAGWEQVRYRESQKTLQQAIEVKTANLHPKMRPHLNAFKHDPPGVQRWVFGGGALFFTGTTQLRPQGRQALSVFAGALRDYRKTWRRIRVEGHTLPPAPGEPDDWELSAARAAQFARVLNQQGHIEPFFLAVSGRAGQDPVNKLDRKNTANERVEVLIEYAQRAATQSTP